MILFCIVSLKGILFEYNSSNFSFSFKSNNLWERLLYSDRNSRFLGVLLEYSLSPQLTSFEMTNVYFSPLIFNIHLVGNICFSCFIFKQGDQLPWLACALYAACRRRSVPTVGGRPGNMIQGNCVSLTRMLQHCNLP